ncbi:MAG TPA: type II toxin-antitoxin system VapC family toxin [Candidatus Hydrogenedentes bacterium]|nr:type II toxin-antitoxin system VapC family toxin [Candidatus Hydrogenedentota bacterium]
MLCDSNILIYAAHPDDTICMDFIVSQGVAIASVTRIEVLGYPGFREISQESKHRLRDLLMSLDELNLTDDVIERATGLRQERRISLADAIVAATALVHDLTLATRNVADFKNIPDLRDLDRRYSP